MSCFICLMGEECAAWEQIKARNHHWGKNEVDVKKIREKNKTVAQKRVCRERYYMRGEELLPKDSSKDVLIAKIQQFMEGRKTEYTSRDRTRKGTFFRENCLCAKTVLQKNAKTVKTYYRDKRLFSFAGMISPPPVL